LLARLRESKHLPPADTPADRLLALLTDGDCEPPGGAVAGALLRRPDVPPGYLTARDADRAGVAGYVAEGRGRAGRGRAGGAGGALSSIVEETPGRADGLRLVGYRLLDLGQPGPAARLFGQVQRDRPFEPHSHRDLARALEGGGRYGLAALQYEVV